MSSELKTTQSEETTDEPKTRREPMPGADILVEALEREGVEVVFGYPGGASMPIHQALTRARKIRTVLPRHEQGESFMAEGYARSTGKVGVCIATSGPGATNLVTGIADAKMDSIPMVAITGQVPTKVIGTDAFQETPIVEICRAITKHHYLVTKTEDIPRVIKEAFYIAKSGRPGPVLVDIPKDLQQQSVVPHFPKTVRLRSYRPETRRAAERDLERVRQVIAESKKPIVYAGGGVLAGEASEALQEFLEKTGIPVASTLMGLGAISSAHPTYLGMLGMHGTVYSNYAVDEADLLLAFGVRFDDRVTGKLSEFCKHGKIVHVDIDPSEVNKNKPAHIPIVGNVRDFLEALNVDLPKPEIGPWLTEIEEQKKKHPMTFEDSEDRIKPQYVLTELDRILDGEAIVCTGVGQHQMWSAQYLRQRHPRQFITSGGLGSMGFGHPAAIGAQVAHPDKKVIDIDGDGSILMNIQELAVMTIENLPVKILILNNQHLGMVVQWEDRFFQGNRGHTYIGNGFDQAAYPDFVTIAKGFGVPAKRITDKKDVAGALKEMVDSDTPYLLDVAVEHQEHVLPMIPSGMTFKDIILK